MAKSFKLHSGLIIVSLCFCFNGADTQCDSRNRFGPNCDFECHCINNEQCNRTTGNCPSYCDFKWVGPKCQRNNIVPAGSKDENIMVSRHQSNIPAFQIAFLAVDRDLSTCSHTNFANRSYAIPFWRLWLKTGYKIRNISIITNKDSLDHFKNFEVMVEQNSERLSNGYNSREVCYKHDHFPPTTTHFDVTCNKQIYGNQLRIQLATNGTQLVLCDVRIYGECPDGTFGVSCTEKCSSNCNDVCDKDYGTCSSCLSGWTGASCNHQVCDDGKYGEKCEFNCSRNCRNSNVCRATDGVCVDGCGLGFEGDKCDQICHDGKYGADCVYDCSGFCTNGTTCRKENGVCSHGCSSGYRGEKCDRACADGYYGQKCLQKCSTNCVGGYVNCEIVFGSCMSGCTAGWIGRKCDEECPIGRWGINCANSCGHCLSGNCQHTDGVCDGGCAAGVQNTPHCDEECKDGSFGINCSGACSKTCKDVCRKYSGECEYCNSGWQGANCTEECENGSWGENCRRRCLTCHNETCNRITGACYSQCKPGFKQTEFCDEECSNGWYGLNCSEECSVGCKDVGFCRKTDGSCLECKPGLDGKKCDNQAEKTMYVSVGGLAAIVVSFIVLIFVSVFVSIFMTRKRLQRNQTLSENETVMYANALAVDANSATLNTPESKVYMEMENTYDTLKRKSGTEHTYE